jgi:predicted nuclease of predicted toxin-antitoxin system
VKLLVDMNLSPSWASRLAQHGFEAVHWSAIGAPTTPDDEILAWAHDQGFVVITNARDFAAFLAATGGPAPSVVQVRMQDLLSDASVDVIVRALEAYRDGVEEGALLSIDESGTRVKMLPLRRAGDRS